jgi:hypothetical protein
VGTALGGLTIAVPSTIFRRFKVNDEPDYTEHWIKMDGNPVLIRTPIAKTVEPDEKGNPPYGFKENPPDREV